MINKLKSFVEIYMTQLSNMNINSQIIDRNRSIILDFISAYESHKIITNNKDKD
jgi:hypothetical protein